MFHFILCRPPYDWRLINGLGVITKLWKKSCKPWLFAFLSGDHGIVRSQRCWLFSYNANNSVCLDYDHHVQSKLIQHTDNLQLPYFNSLLKFYQQRISVGLQLIGPLFAASQSYKKSPAFCLFVCQLKKLWTDFDKILWRRCWVGPMAHDKLTKVWWHWVSGSVSDILEWHYSTKNKIRGICQVAALFSVEIWDLWSFPVSSNAIDKAM